MNEPSTDSALKAGSGSTSTGGLMQFTGKNLLMVRDGISLAIDEIRNQIATCPDVFEYAEDIEELEDEQEKYRKLLARIDRAIAKENQ
jgi:hypothetical protein